MTAIAGVTVLFSILADKKRTLCIMLFSIITPVTPFSLDVAGVAKNAKTGINLLTTNPGRVLTLTDP